MLPSAELFCGVAYDSSLYLLASSGKELYKIQICDCSLAKKQQPICPYHKDTLALYAVCLYVQNIQFSLLYSKFLLFSKDIFQG
jgi:hypothetical protein